ncbi:PLP-dependent transferase [Mycena metata]|uniref:PLP-dependent transferase n=1 Tax=Mycena metata TaxID=1033252 RepID=A0AAD7P269_9AGAR|nr:PLP-dependent transferase [Mycena metata]
MPKKAYADSINGNLHESVSAWFLGPQGENADMLKGLFEEVIKMQTNSRLAYHPEDGQFITPGIKASSNFQAEQADLINQFTLLSELLFAKSIPFFSQRYAGHMSFEMGLPGILGWVATLFNNPNNVAFEASPITTLLEIEVGHEMCEMLGYKDMDANGEPMYWGHIACDGTNLFGFQARNFKYYSLSLRDAMKPGKELNLIADSFKIPMPALAGQMKLLNDLTLWELLNLPPKTILDIPLRLESEYGITPTYLDSVLGKYIVQTRGKQAVELEWGMETPPRYYISGTKHYSWPKGAAIAGLGSEQMMDVPIDIDAHIDTKILRERLQECLDQQFPVFAVVAIIGSTEEGCVDPLDEILDMRDEFEAKGLCFLVHADAAWGGYFASMIRDKPVVRMPKGPKAEPRRDFVPTATLRPHTVKQFRALARTDSITIDPHKAGYLPYPAGGLCYRDGRMRYLVTWSAPYLQQSDSGESIGVYGVEGSKPGAPAVATYLHHHVVGLHKEGHGALLGEVSWSCRRISAHWAAMALDSDPFLIVPLNPLRSERENGDVAAEKEFIRTRILGKPNEEIVNDPEAMAELATLGSDLNINAFVCNFRINGQPNTDVEECNYLNNAVFKRLSITTPNKDPKEIPMFLSATTFKIADYGVCVQHFKERLQLETESNQDLFCLRNVVMSPFQTAGDFVQQLANIFKGILQEEMVHVVARNTITPQAHSFVLQGYDVNASSSHAFLVFMPYFHNANGRFQAILSVDITDESGSRAHKRATSSDILVLTTDKTNMRDICQQGASFNASVNMRDASGNETLIKRVRVSVTQVIKNSPLDSRWRDNDYPSSFVPFYLYASGGRFFIDHTLVQAPNAQMCTEVTLNPPPNIQEQRAFLLSVSRPEVAMQPADAASTRWFVPGASFNVAIYDDTKGATAHGPGLVSDITQGSPIGNSTMTISAGAFIDFDKINTQDFTNLADHRLKSVTSREAHPDTKDEWRKLVRALHQ